MEYYPTNSKVCKQCIIDRQRYPSSREALLEKATSKRGDGIYIISSVIAGTGFCSSLLSNMEEYSKLIDAEIILIGIKSTLTASKTRKDYYPTRSLQYLHRKVKLGGCLVVEDIGIRPTVKHPMSGLSDINDHKNYIVGHPKITKDTIPDGIESSKIVGSTGTISKLSFDSTSKANKALMKGYRYGFFIVEIKGGNLLYCMPVEPSKAGEFFKGGILAKIMGDIHSDRLGKDRRAYVSSFLKKYKSKYTVLHDFISGESISHHNENKPFSKNTIHKRIASEFTCAQRLLRDMSKWDSDTVFVFPYCNHDDHPVKWLDSFRWSRDENNRDFAITFVGFMDEVNPTISYVCKYQPPNKVRILDKSEGFKIGGYQVGVHGHTLTYGRANPQTLNKSLGKSFCGHYHREMCLSNTWFVGKSCDKRQGYNEFNDLSSPTHGVIFEDTSRTMIPDDVEIDLKLEDWNA